MPLSRKQRDALRWVERFGTLPPVHEATWKSLINRGLIQANFSGTPGSATLTDSGRAAL